MVSSSDINHPILPSLDDTQALLEWSQIEALLSSIYSSRTRRPSYPLLTLFHSLLLSVWYQLSDVPLAQALYRDLLLSKFCHLELGGDVPEASTLGRFRTQLVEHDLWEKRLSTINRQLEVKNMIDATPIEAAQSGSDKGKANRNNPLSRRDLKRNKRIAVTRSTAERPFTTYQWHYGLARTWFMGLTKNATVVDLAANIGKGARLLSLYGLPEPDHAR